MTRPDFSSSLVLLALALAPACDGDGGASSETDSADTDTSGPGDGSGGDGTDSGGDGGSDSGGGGDDGGDGGDDGGDGGDDTGMLPEEDHALGTIVLAERHQSASATATGSVSASFIPDAAAVGQGCSEVVAGCEVSVVPDCPTGCGDGQYCGFDDTCTSSCLDICDASCGNDEVCYFAAPGQAACRDREDFDAGSLTFTGTTAPITLLPPYALDGLDTGSPFPPGGQVAVAASGAVAAGFDAFSADFSATTLIQTQLDAITLSEAYGNADLPVEWAAGSDDATITVAVTGIKGQSGTVTCPADDAAGSFSVPRDALRAAVDEQTVAGLSVTVSRRRTEIVTGLTTVGQLLYADVQPVGWLELTSVSSESHTIEGCNFGEAVCDDECVDVFFSEEHCGGCNQPCAGVCSDALCFVDENTDAACDDGDDNDNDGYIDCDDFDCSDNPNVTVCDDGADTGDEGGGGDGGGMAGPDSCIGQCAGMSENCYCDNLCSKNGDCCADFDAVCN